MTKPYEVSREYEIRPYVVPKKRIQLSGVSRLADADRYVWYTPAPLYLWGGLTDVQLSDLQQHYGIEYYWIRFSDPLFEGLTFRDDPGWNHMLWAAKASDWDKLLDGLLSIVHLDAERRRIIVYATQKLMIPDPVVVSKRRSIDSAPPAEVYGFAVRASDKSYAFDNASNLQVTLKRRAAIRTFPADEELTDIAKTIFAGPDLTIDKVKARWFSHVGGKS